ncbi:uncharacterized protein LOC133305834 [Gastrolobium bilobum]|uniref:uncharacterized protein LOC133305834 n=1 Tax=Gastrolobium bilobum TaxID=150636 RepID=UPI002AAFD557|nr:uncharacterized protein LOC133305834 [Gastrolobium bilobum]
MVESSQQSTKRSHHTWTAEEDKALMECLLDIGPSWKGDNGFKAGFAVHLEKQLQQKLPGCTLKAIPHITSRIKLWKRHYSAICEMTSLNGGSGFGWNDKDKMIVVEKGIYNDWVKTHTNAKGLYNKPFPYYEQLGPIFGKDVATRVNAEGPEDAIDEMEREAPVLPDTESINDDFFEYMQDPTQNPMYEPEMPDTITQEGVQNSLVSNSVPKRGKKRARSEDALVVVVADAMKELTQDYRNTNDNIKELVNCFKHESEGSTRKMSVIEELSKIEGLSMQQQVKLATIMGKDNYLIDTFMQGTVAARQCLVAQLLEN